MSEQSIAEIVQALPARQQPEYPDEAELEEVLKTLRDSDPLVNERDIDSLTMQMGRVANGEAFFLQAGDCAETFDNDKDRAKRLLNVKLPMTVTLLRSGIPVIKKARFAGQYAKPRSEDEETVNGISLPSYRGDIINGIEFSENARRADPNRMIMAYNHSLESLGLLSVSATGGYADIRRMHDWNIQFARSSSQGERYQTVAAEIEHAISFMEASGIRVDMLSELHEARMFTSHEGLLLAYELALTRVSQKDPNKLYATSAHEIWIGDRTRDIDEAHVAFASHISNPISVKLGPKTAPDEAVALAHKLNPDNVPGRLTFICRMGSAAIEHVLPGVISAVREDGTSVVWGSDPMHGNTYREEGSGQKTRHFDSIVSEVRSFLEICSSEGVWPGGLHLEVTGDNVTECLGGSEPFNVENLDSDKYKTNCDPRLNQTQSLELAFIVAEHLERNTV